MSVEGSNNWTVYMNDTAGNENLTYVTFNKDTAYPAVTINTPLNQTYDTNSILFNVTATDGGGISACWYSLTAGSVNYSMSQSGDYYTDTNASMTQGSHTVNYYCNDTYNNLNDTEQETFFIDSIYPSITSLIESPSDPATYSSGQKYEFNATITDTNLDTVLIEFDGTNYTPSNLAGDVYNFSITDLAAGNYNYYWYANDSAGNVNQTSDSYTINNASGNITLLINDSASDQSGPYGIQTNASASTLYGSVTLYRNGTDITGENNNFVTLGVGYYNYTAYSPGDQNHSTASITRSVEITKATSEVNLTLNVTDGNVTINQYNSIYLNGTLITGDSSATLKLYNNDTLINQGNSPLSNLTTFSTIGVFNITVFYIESQNYTSSYETWWVNVTEALDSQNPSVSSLTETPTDPANYSEGAVYEFNATIIDTGVGLDTIFLDFNGVNYTPSNLAGDVYNVTITDLAVSTYDYRWYANDSAGNMNGTENGTYTVNKATPSLSLTILPSTSETYGTETTANGTGCPSQLTCNLYRNDTGEVTPPDVVTLGVGVYNYTYNTTENANYTNASVSDILTINPDTSSCSVLFNESSGINYGTIFRVWTNCTSGFVLYRNSSAIGNNSEQNLAVSSYNFTVIRNDTVNYSNIYDEEQFIIQKATGEVYTYLNNSRSNITIDQYTEIYLNATLQTGVGDIKLYNNNTLINQGSSPLSNLTQFNETGLFNTTTFYDGNENYTSAYETWWVNVLEIDITKPEISIVYPLNNTNTTNVNINVNYTVSDNQAVDSCWYSNDTYSVNISLGSGGSCINITTVTWSQGQHNVIVWANDTSGNENSSSVTFSVDNILPTIGFVAPTETSGISLGRNYIQINMTASDDNLDTIIVYLYNSTSLVQTNTSSVSPSFINFTGLSAETYYYNATANDTFGNNISTETRNISLVLPELNIIKPENETYIHTDNLLLDYTADYEDYVWYNIDQLGSNETITGNTTFNTTQGSHIFYLYANNTLGETVRNVSFSVDINKFRVIYDEYAEANKGSSTDFNQSSYEDLQSLSNVILENTNWGKISFNGAINVTDDFNFNDNETNLDNNTNISENRIELNSTALPNFNGSATLYLYSLTLDSPVRILRDGSACPSSICTQQSYSGGTLIFNVTQFTIYSAEEISDGLPPPGGGAGRPTREVECTGDSECTEDEVCWNFECVKLFDVKIIEFESPIKLGEFFYFTYLIKGMADINRDVEVNFWIEKNKEVITSGLDTIYLGSFEEKTETTKIFLPTSVESGIYDFIVQIEHANYSAKSQRTIEIKVDEGIAKIVPIDLTNLRNYVISGLIILAIFILFIIFYLERKKIKKGIEQGLVQETRWLKKHKVSVLVFALFIILGVLAYSLNLFGFLARWLKTSSFNYFLKAIIVLFGLLIVIFIIRKTNFFQRFSSWRAERREINLLNRAKRRELNLLKIAKRRKRDLLKKAKRRKIEGLKREKIRRKLMKVSKVKPKIKPLIAKPRRKKSKFMKAFTSIITSPFKLLEEITMRLVEFSGKVFRAFKIPLKTEKKVVKKVKKPKPIKKREPKLRILSKLKKALNRVYSWSKKVDRFLLRILKKTLGKFKLPELGLEKKISRFWDIGKAPPPYLPSEETQEELKDLGKLGRPYRKIELEFVKIIKNYIIKSVEYIPKLIKIIKNSIVKFVKHMPELIKSFKSDISKKEKDFTEELRDLGKLGKPYGKIELEFVKIIKKSIIKSVEYIPELIRSLKPAISKKEEYLAKEGGEAIKQTHKDVFYLLKKIFGRKSHEKIIHDFENKLVKTEKFAGHHLKTLRDVVGARLEFEKTKANIHHDVVVIRRKARVLIRHLTNYLYDMDMKGEKEIRKIITRSERRSTRVLEEMRHDLREIIARSKRRSTRVLEEMRHDLRKTMTLSKRRSTRVLEVIKYDLINTLDVMHDYLVKLNVFYLRARYSIKMKFFIERKEIVDRITDLKNKEIMKLEHKKAVKEVEEILTKKREARKKRFLERQVFGEKIEKPEKLKPIKPQKKPAEGLVGKLEPQPAQKPLKQPVQKPPVEKEKVYKEPKDIIEDIVEKERKKKTGK
jgi:hypothetical protein